MSKLWDKAGTTTSRMMTLRRSCSCASGHSWAGYVSRLQRSNGKDILLMNRFIIDREPEAIAQQLCDQHIIKMVLEEAQMLNTAVRLHAPEFAEEAGLYKIAYKNHPCTQWARETRVNYRFAVRLMKAMNDEYMWRYPKRSDGTVNTGHASMRHFDALGRGREIYT